MENINKLQNCFYSGKTLSLIHRRDCLQRFEIEEEEKKEGRRRKRRERGEEEKGRKRGRKGERRRRREEERERERERKERRGWLLFNKHQNDFFEALQTDFKKPVFETLATELGMLQKELKYLKAFKNLDTSATCIGYIV